MISTSAEAHTRASNHCVAANGHARRDPKSVKGVRIHPPDLFVLLEVFLEDIILLCYCIEESWPVALGRNSDCSSAAVAQQGLGENRSIVSFKKRPGQRFERRCRSH